MSKFLSGRQSNLKLGVSGYTENKTVLETTGKVGIGTTDAQQYSLFVVGPTNITGDTTVGSAITMYASTGIISATAFHGDGSNLANTGATLSAAAGTQRLVVTSLTSGTMVDAATDSDLTFNATTNTLNTDNLIVAGNLTVDGTQTILNTTQLEVTDINIGIASANPKLNDAQLDGAGITIHGLNGDKTLTWSNANSRLEFNTDVNVTNLELDNNQKVKFGTSGDLEIYHAGTFSVIKDTSGSLVYRSGTHRIRNQGGIEDLATFNSNGSVDLYYDNSLKFQTIGYGVTIYNDLTVGTGVTIYGNAGIVSATSFYGDGSNLTNTGATLSATSGVERLVTTQLTSGTMVDAATDADLTFNAGNNTLNTQNIQISGGISTNGSSYGQDGQLLRSTGTGWEWRTVPGIFSVNNILNGFNVLEEGSVVGTAGSIHTLDFRGINVFASGDPQPNGIATVTFSPSPTFTGVNLTGVSTITGTITAGSSEGVVGQYLRHVGTGVTWASFPQLRVTQTNTATAGQNTFNFSYNIDFLDVFVNGVKLTSSEYSANNGSQIVLNTPAFAGEIVEFHSYNVASTYGAGSGGGASNLTGLSDVNFPIALADDQLLQFNSSTNVWENVPVTSVTPAGISTTGTSFFNVIDTPIPEHRIPVIGAGGTISHLPGFTYQSGVLYVQEGTGTISAGGEVSSSSLSVSGNSLLTGDVEVSTGRFNIGVQGGYGATITNAGVATFSGSVTAPEFFGDGSGLTNLSAGNLTGALPAIDASNVTGIVTTNIGKANVTISDAPPGIGTAHGDLWWESDTAKGHIYYNDGSSAQWVEFNPSSGGGGGGGGGSYGDSDVDSHLNVGTASTGEVLSWNGSDYDWVAQSGGGGDAATLDGIDSASFLRSDDADEKTSGDLTFNDSVKLNLGTHGDMSIFFNGSHTFMDSSVGNINIRTVAPSGGDVIVGSGISDYFRADSSTGESILYHYGNQKLATKSDGIDVTGHTETDTLNVSGIGTLADIHVKSNPSDTRITSIAPGALILSRTTPVIYFKDNLSDTFDASIELRSNELRFRGGGNDATAIRMETIGAGVTVTGTTFSNQLSVSGVATATSFSGSGAGLTNLPSSQLTGALPAIDGSALTNVSVGSTDLVSTWTLGANGSSHYTFTGPGVAPASDDPTIYLVRGQTYKFENRTGGHPFRIQYEFQNTSGTAYNDGIVNNGAGNNTDLYWEVRNDAPDLLHYQCTSHQNMSGRIVILGDVVSSGSWSASAGTAQTIDTITGVANNAIKTAEYTIHIENGSNMQAQKVLVMQDGTTAFSQEYAIMHKSGLLVSMSATISGGNLLLQATPETGVSGTTTYKVTRQTMR